MRNVAILGGTFNPVHIGHLLMAETALDQFGLDQIIWVPTAHPPHKQQSLLGFRHRLEMVQRAIAKHPAFMASEVDAKRQGVSYAITTLTDLQSLYPNTNWFWIIGRDAFQTLPQWRESDNLAQQCTWLIAPRKSKDEEKEKAEGSAAENPPSPSLALTPTLSSLRYQLLKMPEIGISSSLIRQRMQEGRSIRYLVPEPVRLYILEFKLYAK